MAKAKAAAKKSSSSKHKAKEPIVEVAGLEPTDDVTFEAAEMPKEPGPNVIWSGEKKEDGSLKFGNPPAVVKVGIRSISVPDADKQLAGFYSPDARALVRNINGYKFLQPKG